MKIDPESWLLATAAAGLLLAGGAFMRAAFFGPRLAHAGVPPDPAERGAREQALAALQSELAAHRATTEAERAAMAELRQRSERQVQGAQAEIQRLAAELETERQRARTAEEESAALRATISGLQEEARASSTDRKALASLSGQVAELQRRVVIVTEERDKMQAKTEALERLIEGVRARSRDLAEQLKRFKGEAP